MIIKLDSLQHAACKCGACSFKLAESAPVARFICHCTICQQYNNKPFADVTILKKDLVQINDEENIEFYKYRQPPNINRGLCKKCGQPAIEIGGAGPAKFALIPTDNFKDKNLLPPPAIHMFYHHRIEDIVDDLPKYTGYLTSEFAVIKLMYRLLKA
ncbi:GFA family protein [Vibrio parahaemolyticus]|uniref:GFA family protein n=1 Tax=Vibrio parahaemolyticus TaxID=670 RepID=UPI0006B26728|nr:GFA family protein [Vibrio parahaemolyticus]EGQ7765758.1 hypothetical protein [Vibrio parahaemolyticus]EGQ7896085.1 hypothetical protein [Vibrio parahaemolyticus]EGQ8070953.1 hypothetical protein [Vibrio parahaemolyticus]EGQ8486270.1 hypothetical protein [Vibrio parahaemolyticus]EGQ9522486.1 hypothetical protein [Vibrio parahaemolyticus]